MIIWTNGWNSNGLGWNGCCHSHPFTGSWNGWNIYNSCVSEYAVSCEAKNPMVQDWSVNGGTSSVAIFRMHEVMLLYNSQVVEDSMDHFLDGWVGGEVSNTLLAGN